MSDSKILSEIVDEKRKIRVYIEKRGEEYFIIKEELREKGFFDFLKRRKIPIVEKLLDLDEFEVFGEIQSFSFFKDRAQINYTTINKKTSDTESYIETLPL